MTNTQRITTFVISCLIGGIAMLAAGASGQPPTPSEVIATAPFTAEEQALIDFGRSRFAMAGIDLPEVRIEFAGPRDCFGYGGLYLPDETTVRLCRPAKRTMVHELAHAWIEATLTGDERAAFLRLRELETWSGGEGWDPLANISETIKIIAPAPTGALTTLRPSQVRRRDHRLVRCTHP